MEEIWKSLKNVKYDYQISNYGRFRNNSRNSKITTGSFDKRGYLRVYVRYKDNSVKTKKVHRLVCEYFYNNYKEELTVNHIDLNKSNNRIDNLEMIEIYENVIHYQENIVQKKSSSSKRGVGFHKGINKWTSRVTIDGKRFSLGVFNTEYEAIESITLFEQGKASFKIGKGCSNIGSKKYSEIDDINALLLAKEIGVRKAGKQTKMGSTRISKLRKNYTFNGDTYIKNNEN